MRTTVDDDSRVRAQTVTHIDQLTAFDEPFDAEAPPHTATMVGLTALSSCLILLAISWRRAARNADTLAAQLRAREGELDWVRRGVAGLDDALRGELEVDEVANRSVGYLGGYLDSPVAALYVVAPDRSYVLRGTHGRQDGHAPRRFTAGDGLLGQVVANPALLVSTSEVLRAILPITHGGVRGVLELALRHPLADKERELLEQVQPLIAIALERALAYQPARRTVARSAGELADYKAQFLSSLVHELRTPLNAIVGFAEILRDDTHAIDADTQHEYLGDILASGRSLLALINDVIDLAKLEAGTVEFHPQALQLAAVTSEVLADLRPLSTSQRIAVHLEIASEVESLMLDPVRLKQVLYSYLSNAFAATSGGSVTVRAHGEGDRVRIEVEDNGIGISPEDVPELFEQRVGPRRAGSTGLGLALTKRLVEAQGGEVGVRSALGEGSVFHAILPRTFTSPRAPTILVVETQPAERERLADTLAKAGYAVETAGTGSEALAHCETRTYDAITLGLLLPDMTGLEVLRRIREGHRGQVPVIVTVVLEPGVVSGVAVHDVLAKPLAADALRGSLRRIGVDPKAGQVAVLVIDDDPASLEVMAASLTRLGYLAVCERDPARGLRAATEEPPSAIVLDLVMPSMTGFEFLEELRRVPAARAIPVILWTSSGRDELMRVPRSALKGDRDNARVLAELAASLPGREERVGA